ncbi:MAG: threonine aldolase [Candidatus Meridianibacter frigidus]|nr:MAG: threonine aldolase [Candidatus Eremiobacteraeota bacterium]
MLRTFASDNAAPAHPAVLEAIARANSGQAVSYGEDSHTRDATRRFREIFGSQTEVLFTFNGTGANVTAIASLLSPFEAVICPASAHLNTDECGALERFAGIKILAVPTPNGKLTPELIGPFAQAPREEHHVQPRLISLSQTTEFGGVYSTAELAAICNFARAHDLLVHMDGARLSNAAAALDLSLHDATTGIDVLSFGGTKNGLIFGEAVVFLEGSLQRGGAKFVRKQAMQLASKMRFISAQFEALLTNDLWLLNARHANAMASRLEMLVRDIRGIKISRPVEANAVFAVLPREIIAPLQREFFFYLFDEARCEARWMTSFDTTPDDVDAFAILLRRLLTAPA